VLEVSVQNKYVKDFQDYAERSRLSSRKKSVNSVVKLQGHIQGQTFERFRTFKRKEAAPAENRTSVAGRATPPL
jgi:hypothetical protein